MVAASILPVTIYKNKLLFLFGKENPLEDSSKGWSDFGGGVEKDETPYTTALREGSEELSGFFGNKKDIEKLIHKNGGFYKLVHNDYHVHLFYIHYDENLPNYYNKNHHFLWNRMDKHYLNNSKLFEKIEIKWFSIESIKKNKNIFRSFYKEIVDKIITENENIYSFVNKNIVKHKKTLKNHDKI